MIKNEQPNLETWPIDDPHVQAVKNKFKSLPQ